MPMSGFFKPAAVKTSITCPSVVMTAETSCRIVASICSGGLLVERRLDGLEKRHGVAYGGGFVAGGAEGEGVGKFRHHFHKALLAVLLFQNVLLAGRDEHQPLGGLVGRPLVPVEPMHHVAGDAVFFHHHDDS